MSGSARTKSMSKEEREEMINEVEEIEKTMQAWHEFSGMHTLLEELQAKKDEPMDVNDLTLAMATGIDSASEKAVNGVLESAVVAALLISFSLPLVVDPPDAIADLDNNDWRKICHLLGWGCMSILGIANILYARVYTAAMARAVRASDKLRIHLTGNAFTEGLLMVYGIFVFLCMGLLPDMILFYGNALGIILILLTVLGIGIAVKLSYKYIQAGHIEYGWRWNRISRGDPVNDMLLFETLKKRIERGKRLRDADKAFFVFDNENEHITGAQGISTDGQDLLGLLKVA